MNLLNCENFNESAHAHYYKCLKLKRRLDFVFKIAGALIACVCIYLGLSNFYITFLGSFGGNGVFFGIAGSLAMIFAGGFTAYVFTEKNVRMCFYAALSHLVCAALGFAFVSIFFALLTLAMCVCCKIYIALQNTEGYPYFNTRQAEEEEKKHKESTRERTLRLMRERDEAESIGQDMPTINFLDQDS